MSSKKSMQKLYRDLCIIAASIVFAIFLTRTGIFAEILLGSAENAYIGAFVAGLFFTSFFTTPLSIAAFATLAHSIDPFTLASIGVFGSVVGDLLLFLFVRHAVKEDMDSLLKIPTFNRLPHLFKRRIFHWILPFIGALVIASPLPDELGIALMGVSQMPLARLILISFAMNFLGILFIATLAA